jgi:hypothetical protein
LFFALHAAETQACERSSKQIEEKQGMVGILVHGDNHFILSGPEPTGAEATRLASKFTLVEVGKIPANLFEKWEIRNKEFRENLEWAVIVPADTEITRGVSQLLGELADRGVVIRTCK